MARVHDRSLGWRTGFEPVLLEPQSSSLPLSYRHHIIIIKVNPDIQTADNRFGLHPIFTNKVAAAVKEKDVITVFANLSFILSEILNILI